MALYAAHKIPLEVVHTMVEMAELAHYALERRSSHSGKAAAPPPPPVDADEAARLRSENLRLRAQLSDYLALLEDLRKAPGVANDCPPDLYSHLLDTVNSPSFLNKLELVHQDSKDIPNGGLCSGDITEVVEVPIIIEDGEPSWWILVPHDIFQDNLEEASGIDGDNYVIISEENVIDGIGNFIARCIVENPKSKLLSPEDLLKTLLRALGDVGHSWSWKSVWEAGKIIYTLSTCGLALAGLYRHRAILRAAAKGVGASANVVLKAL